MIPSWLLSRTTNCSSPCSSEPGTRVESKGHCSWTHELGRAAGELVYPANSELDIGELMAEWFLYWLTGIDTGVAEWPAARVYLMGAIEPGNEWLELAANLAPPFP